MVESTKYNTFFDIGIQEDPSKEFAQMRCYIYGNKKIFIASFKNIIVIKLNEDYIKHGIHSAKRKLYKWYNGNN